MLQDIHAHLQDIKDPVLLSGMMDGIEKNGVGRIVCNATSPLDWDGVAAISGKYKNVVPFFGIHPWMVKRAGLNWEDRLRKILLQASSGVGEIGLDHGKFRPDHALQLSTFTTQLDIAIELKRPVAIHCVGAWGTLLGVLKERPMKDAPFMMHLFSGSVDVMKEIVGLGGYISFSLGISEGGPEKVRAAFQAVPVDRFLLETDYPYVPDRPEEPSASPDEYFSRLKKVYEKAALLKGVKSEDLEKRVWENGTVFMRGIASR